MNKLWIRRETVTGGRFYGVFTYDNLLVIGFIVGRFAIYIGWSNDPDTYRSARIRPSYNAPQYIDTRHLTFRT